MSPSFMRLHAFVYLLVVLTALHPGAVFAQTQGPNEPAPVEVQPAAGLAPVAPPPAEQADSPEYKRAIEQALAEYRLGHFEEARSLFERAHAIDPSARTLRGLGMVEFELRHYVRAAELLEASLASAQKPLTPEQRRSVEELTARTRQFIANYSVKVKPPGEAVTLELDGKPIELGPAGRLALEAGEHTLRISGPELTARELKLDVKGGEEQVLRIELEVKEPRPTSTLTAPTSQPRAPARPYRSTGIALTAVGGAALVASGVLGALALSSASDASLRDDSDADSARGLALGSDIALGVGIASVAAGITLWVWRGRARSDVAAAKVAVASRGLGMRF